MSVLEAVVGGFLGMWAAAKPIHRSGSPHTSRSLRSEFGAVVLPASYVLPKLRVPMRDVGLSTRRFMIAAAMASSVTMTS